MTSRGNRWPAGADKREIELITRVSLSRPTTIDQRNSALDSTGVTALLDLRKQANDRGIDMEILAVSRRAARVLALVGLAESFGIPADPDTAPGQSADSDS